MPSGWIDGQAVNLPQGATYADALRAIGSAPRHALAVRIGGETLALDAPFAQGADAHALTIANEEGRRAYERALRFVLLLAVRRVLPDARVRVENSTQRGVYVLLGPVTPTPQDVLRLKDEMRSLIDRDLPFVPQALTKREAAAYFEATHQPDKVRLLRYRGFDRFSIYACDGLQEYFYGVMPPSTGYCPVFNLCLHAPGIELLLPDPDMPTRPAKPVLSPKLAQTFAESARWTEILGCQNVADLNEMVETDNLREFIRVNEALHEKSIAHIAEMAVSQNARLILIAGPSSSGKTTFAHRLSIQLRVLGLRPLRISLDDYYKDRDALPLEADGKPDLERIDTLDLPRINADLADLLAGGTVALPLFNFVTGKRATDTRLERLQPGQPVVIEGLHALNPALTRLIPRSDKFLIYISALTSLNLDDHNRIRTTDARLLRRLVRDLSFRHTPARDTLAMWDSVRAGERTYILPYQESADVFFNSTLHYELAFLKPVVQPLLEALTPSDPYYTRAHRLLKFLHYVVPADVEDEIPLNSILREFIGGCCFYRE